jgi:hypothetical protein
VETGWPSARIRAAIFLCPHAGQSAAYFAASASIASVAGTATDLTTGSPTRSRASRRRQLRSGSGQAGEADTGSWAAALGLEVCEGTWSTSSAPLCQIRNCTVAAASASFNSWISARCRRSTTLAPRSPPGPPGRRSSIAALPASTNRLRHVSTDAADTHADGPPPPPTPRH